MTTPEPRMTFRSPTATQCSRARNGVRRALILTAITMLAACQSHRQDPLRPVPVNANARDMQLLVGDWQGEFVSEEGGRRGKIAFRLMAGRDTAEGLVTVDGPAPHAGCVDPVSLATAPKVIGQLALTLGTVNVGEPSVGGWLRPYPDPELGCLMDTWFEGTIDGDTLRGMYFTNPADTAKALRLGNWWVARRR